MVKKTPGASKPDMKSGNKVSPDERTDIPHAPHSEGHGAEADNPGRPNRPRPK